MPEGRGVQYWEPMAVITILTPQEYVGPLLGVLEERRGQQEELSHLDGSRVLLRCPTPFPLTRRGQDAAFVLCSHCPSRPRRCLCLVLPLPVAAKTLSLSCAPTALAAETLPLPCAPFRGQDAAFVLCSHCPSRLR